MIKEQIGKEIKKYRQLRGFSQEKLASICNIDRTYISSVESGKRNIAIENLSKIATALELDLMTLFSFDSPIRNTIILEIKGEKFLIKTSIELNRNLKIDIESITSCAFDEDSDFVKKFESKGIDIYEATSFEIAGIFQEIIKEELNIDIYFKRIDLEVKIDE